MRAASARRTISARCASVATGRCSGSLRTRRREEVVERADRAAEQAAASGRAGRARRGRRPTRSARSGSVRRPGAPDSAPAGARLCPRSQALRGGRVPPSHRRAASGRVPGPPSRRLCCSAATRRLRAFGRRPRRATARPGILPGAVVAEIRCLRAAARVRIGDAEGRALRLVDLLAAVVANQNGFPSHVIASRVDFRAQFRRNQAAARAARMRHERSRLSVASSSRSSPVSRAPTTRKLPRAEILDRSPVQVLLDDSRADIGGARRRPACFRASPRPSASPRAMRLLRLGLALGRLLLGELDRGSQRAAPRPEVLGREFLAQMGRGCSRSAAAGRGCSARRRARTGRAARPGSAISSFIAAASSGRRSRCES